MSSFLDFSFLKNKPFYHKLLVLLMLFSAMYIIVPIFIVLISIPVFGKEILDSMTASGITSNIYWLKFVQLTTQIGVFAGTAWIYARLNTKKTGEFLYLSKRGNLSLYIYTILSLLFSLPLVYALMQLNQQIQLPISLAEFETSLRNQEAASEKIMELFLNVSTIDGLIFNLFLIAIVPAVCEELLFRGALQRILLERTKNIHIAVVISAILFSAMHMQFFSFLPRLALGLVLGYAVAYGMSLWPAVLAHAINNGISVVAAYLYYNGYISSNYQDVGGTSNVWIILFTALVSAFFVFLLFKKRAVPENLPL